MKTLSLIIAAGMFFAVAAAQACPGMEKITSKLKTQGGQYTDAAQTPNMPQVDKKLIVDVAVPADEEKAAN